MKIKATIELLEILFSGFYFFKRETRSHTFPVKTYIDEELKEGECFVVPHLSLYGKQTHQKIKVLEEEVVIANPGHHPPSTYHFSNREAFEKTLQSLVGKIIDLPEWVFMTVNFRGKLKLQCFKIEYLPEGKNQVLCLGEIVDGYHELEKLNERWTESENLNPRECPETPPLYNEVLFE